MLNVHPVAEICPLLSEEELAELAADIKARGLIHPIVVDQDGQILDGRNRYLACGIAGIDPTYEQYEGDDPGGYALAVNIARRHLSKGQQAMIKVKAELFDTNNERIIQDVLAAHGKVSQSRIAYASVVLQYAPELVDDVIAGYVGLDAAYEEAKTRKQAELGSQDSEWFKEGYLLAAKLREEQRGKDDAKWEFGDLALRFEQDRVLGLALGTWEEDQTLEALADGIGIEFEELQMFMKVSTRWRPIDRIKQLTWKQHLVLAAYKEG